MSKFLNEFKEFAMRGNVMDMAVGVIVGGALEAVTLNYGNFIQEVVNFLIIAFCIFLAIKGINSLSKKKEEVKEEPAAPAPTKEETLLTEIRDLLKNK